MLVGKILWWPLSDPFVAVMFSHLNAFLSLKKQIWKTAFAWAHSRGMYISFWVYRVTNLISANRKTSLLLVPTVCSMWRVSISHETVGTNRHRLTEVVRRFTARYVLGIALFLPYIPQTLDTSTLSMLCTLLKFLTCVLWALYSIMHMQFWVWSVLRKCPSTHALCNCVDGTCMCILIWCSGVGTVAAVVALTATLFSM